MRENIWEENISNILLNKIEFRPKPRPLTTNGQCTNDPHCKTFDQSYFEFQYKDGEFVVYENKKLQLWVKFFLSEKYAYLNNNFFKKTKWNQIHLISKSCSSLFVFSNYCIEEIYIQSIDDFVSYKIKRAPELEYIDLSSPNKTVLPLIWQSGSYQFSKAGAIQISKDDSYFYVS